MSVRIRFQGEDHDLKDIKNNDTAIKIFRRAQEILKFEGGTSLYYMENVDSETMIKLNMMVDDISSDEEEGVKFVEIKRKANKGVFCEIIVWNRGFVVVCLVWIVWLYWFWLRH